MRPSSTTTRAAASARRAARARRWVVDTLRRIEEGIAHPDEVDLLLQLCDNIEGKCLCPLGDSLAMPVRAIVKLFREEFDEHVRQGGCTCPESRPAARSTRSRSSLLPAGGGRR